MNHPNQVSSILEVVERKPKIIQCIQALNEESLIEACILQIYNKVDKILLIEGAVENKVKIGQATPDGHSIDNTVQIIKRVIAEKDPDNKIIFIQIDRAFKDLEELKNMFFNYMSEDDWMLITDVDEFIHPETVDLLRKAITIEPHATEFVPTFYHFWHDKNHIRNPGGSNGAWGCQHQRFIKFQYGLNYKTHPVAADKNGVCTYFDPRYLPRRFVLPGFEIFHYSYMNFRKDAILGKRAFYDKELGQEKHGNVAAYERGGNTFEFENYIEPNNEVLFFDGIHPEIIQQQKWFNTLDERMMSKSYMNYKQAEPYSLDNPQLIWAWRNKPGYSKLFNKVDL